MRIIIGLIEHMGDIVACEPVSRYIRSKYPEAQISWAVSAPYRELIDSNPHIDETVVLGCLTDWIKLAKHGKYDEIIDLHVNYRVCEHCRVPLVKERGNPFVSAYEWFDYGALLEAFSQGAGLAKLTAQPRLYLGPEHVAAVNALALPQRFCVVHRESNNIDKDWSAENWCALAEFIALDLGMPIVEVGAGKAADPSPIADLSIDLFNRLPILQTAEVIRRADFFIGIDSGPAHLANAVRTPGVVLLGRLGVFRQYNPFTGYYAEATPEVKLVRNPIGPARDIGLADMIEAVRYVHDVLGERPPPPAGPETAAREVPTVAEADRALVANSGMFDRHWYVLHCSAAAEAGIDPLDHFIAVGGHDGCSPGPDFDARDYLRQHPDVARARVNPLIHYLQSGRREGRKFIARAATQMASEGFDADWARDAQPVLPVDSAHLAAAEQRVPPSEMPRAFAFYLPQFHPIAENNLGHRPGFTEWDNVIAAKPQFERHYQPRLPGELGYYDLRAIDVMREQVRLALEHGLSGFCFYYYYFHGKKLLYRPIENYIASDIQAPFFFLWANENWSRRWDGGDHEIIIAQEHSPQDDLVFIRDLIAVFSDPRYVRIGGKPLLMIYKAHLFPDILATTERWRDEMTRHGFPDLYLVMVDDWTPDPPHPRTLGFDASYEIPSNLVPEAVLSNETDALGLKDTFEGRIVDYQKFAQFHMSRPFPEYKRFRTVMLPWDNTPRYAGRAMIHVNTGGDSYKEWLKQALLDTRTRYSPEERIVLVHSWNEWCEGTYLEPDGKYGRRYLEETRAAMRDVRTVVALDQAGGNGTALSVLQKLAHEKDMGALRMLQALRMQPFYLYRELERVRAENLALRNRLQAGEGS